MTMVVDYRQVFGMTMEQLLCSLIGQHEFFVDECAHYVKINCLSLPKGPSRLPDVMPKTGIKPYKFNNDKTNSQAGSDSGNPAGQTI